MLEESFARDNMPDKEERLRLVEAVGMTYKQIVVWFQNRRAKERSDERKLYFSSRQAQRSPPPQVPAQVNEVAVPRLQQHSSPTGAPQHYPTASAAMHLVQMATAAPQRSSTNLAGSPRFQTAGPDYRPQPIGPPTHVPDKSQAVSPGVYSPGTSGGLGLHAYPTAGVVLPPPPPAQGSGVGVASDLLRFSLASSHFQNHVPLKAPIPAAVCHAGSAVRSSPPA